MLRLPRAVSKRRARVGFMENLARVSGGPVQMHVCGLPSVRVTSTGYLHSAASFATAKAAAAVERTGRRQGGSAGLGASRTAPSLQAVLNRRIRAGTFEAFLHLAQHEAEIMDQANLVIGLSRIVREVERRQAIVSKRAGDTLGSEGVPQAASRCGEGGVAPMASRLLSLLARGLADTSSPHTLANMAWALAKLAPLLPDPGSEVGPARLLQLTVRRALTVGLGSFPGRDLPLIVWGAATLHRGLQAGGGNIILRCCPEVRASLFGALSGPDIVLRLPEVPAQNLAMLMWALASLKNNGRLDVDSNGPDTGVVEAAFPRLLFAAAGEEAALRVNDLTAREVANISWAFATAQVNMQAWVVDELPLRAHDFQPQECANALWALAASGHSLDSIAARLSAVLGVSGEEITGVATLRQWKAQEMANAAWALAQSHTSAVPRRVSVRGNQARIGALRALHTALADRVQELAAPEVSMVASTLNTVEAAPGQFVQDLASRARELLDRNRLPPDAAVQVVDSLADSGVPVPVELAEEVEGYYSAALAVLQAEPHARRSVQGIGPSTLGARSTRRLLPELGVNFLCSEDGEEEALHWPPSVYLTPQVHCMMEFNLLITLLPGARHDSQHQHAAVASPAALFSSGSTPDNAGIGALVSTPLRFPRDRDAEFLALTAVIAAARQSAARLLGQPVSSTSCSVPGLWTARGSVRMRISHTPCLSCVSAMTQFRHLFPDVRLDVTFGDVWDGSGMRSGH